MKIIEEVERIMAENRKRYIGDSVYADFTGYYIVLTTENGYPDDPRNRIFLEPSVYSNLLLYVESLKEKDNE